MQQCTKQTGTPKCKRQSLAGTLYFGLSQFQNHNTSITIATDSKKSLQLQKDSKDRPTVATRRQRSQQTFTTKPTSKTAARLKPANCNRQQQFEHSKPTKFKQKI